MIDLKNLHHKLGENEVFAFSEEVTPDLCREAYANGLFPWPTAPEDPIPWVSPNPRAVLEFNSFTMHRSFFRFLKKTSWKVSFNRAFESVLQKCAIREEPEGTWLIPSLQSSLLALHRTGQAHSVEIWCEDDLVGGLYGVLLGGVFSAESMFHLQANASKLALWSLVQRLKMLGFSWIDIQMQTEHLSDWGASEISRLDFFSRIESLRRDEKNIAFSMPERSRPPVAHLER